MEICIKFYEKNNFVYTVEIEASRSKYMTLFN